jgi:hypothetical protein
MIPVGILAGRGLMLHTAKTRPSTGDKSLQYICYHYHKQNNGIFNVCSVV